MGNQHFCEKFPHSTRKQGIGDQFSAVVVVQLNWTPQDYDVSMTLRQHIIVENPNSANLHRYELTRHGFQAIYQWLVLHFRSLYLISPGFLSNWTLYNNHS